MVLDEALDSLFVQCIPYYFIIIRIIWQYKLIRNTKFSEAFNKRRFYCKN